MFACAMNFQITRTGWHLNAVKLTNLSKIYLNMFGINAQFDT